MDTLIKALRVRGHKIEVSWRRTNVELFGQTNEQIKLREQTSGRGQGRVGRSPTGKLYFCAGIGCSRRWADGKELLEGKVALIIATLELDAQWLIGYWEKNRLREKQEEEERSIRRKLQSQKEEELRQFKSLLDRAKRWEDAKLMREYITSIDAKGRQTGKLTQELEAWIIWAKGKADWYDPDTSMEDDLLSDVDRDTLQFKKDF